MLACLLATLVVLGVVRADTDVRLYTRDPMQDAVYNNTYNTKATVTAFTENLQVTLNGFQNVISLADLGSVTLDINVTTRTSRFVVFCIWPKNRIDPIFSPIGDKGPDYFKVSCTAANHTASLELTNRLMITKPDGLL